MSFCFLVNPTSGGGAAPGAVVPVARLLREAGERVEVSYSPGPLATRALVWGAVARGDVVVSVGGDGMLSSLAGEVSRAGGVLGVLPAGRGNDFARMLDLPGSPGQQAALLRSGRARRVDLLRCGDRVVAGSVYAGVDARAAAIVDTWRRLPRPLHYPVAAVRALATYRPGRYRLVVDGVVRELDAATVVVANSAYYGKGMRIAPAASLTDGLLDVVVVGAASRPALVRALPGLYDGRHVERDEVQVFTGTRVELSTTGGPQVPVGGDGEPLGTLPDVAGGPPLSVEVSPGALTVLAP
jgi:diacylglycerol kinase family enzyme